MGSDKKSSDTQPTGTAQGRGDQQPEWAAGLKQLYDSVVEEELPDSFKNLLAQLDEGSGDGDCAPTGKHS
ncbi:MAG: NepR family anti-sigma factor [Pseudomonadota bacterium]